MHILAPIALFCYNRPKHTLQVLEALSNNDLANESVLYIFADGPKSDSKKDILDAIIEVRSIINSKKWAKEVHIIEQNENKGLANSIVDGISEVVNKYGKIIVLEDDIVPEKGFLKYMNESLDLYEDEHKVMNVSAYMYPNNLQETQPSTFFLRIAAGWGWATWERAWKHYNHNIEDHINKLTQQNSVQSFNIDGSINLFGQLLANKDKKMYTWGVRWYASWFTNGGYNLFPAKSLVKNIGFDGSGVHCDDNNIFNTAITDYISVEKQPVIENAAIRASVHDFFISINENSAKPNLVKIVEQIKNSPPAIYIRNKLSSIF